MSMFLKKNDVALINGGYLVNKVTKSPVFNMKFVDAQKGARQVILLAEKVKVSNFESTKVDNFKDLVIAMREELKQEDIREYKKAPKEESTPTIDKLKDEALSWLNSKGDEAKVEKINRIMQRFNILQDFETYGLFFEEGEITKLSKLYTVKEILEAIEILEPHLD